MSTLPRYSTVLRVSFRVRGFATNGAARSTRLEWTEQVSIPLAEMINKDAYKATGDFIMQEGNGKRQSEYQARKAREKQRKAWMGKEISPFMDRGWDFEGKWRGEDLPDDTLPNGRLRKVLLTKRTSGIKTWLPIANLPPGDLIHVATESQGADVSYKTDKGFWDAICRRAEYISHCFTVKQIRKLLNAFAAAECTAHPGLLRKLSSELLERFPQLTLLSCAECAEAYQRLGFDHTGTYVMLALAFVQEMESIRYPLVGSEPSVSISPKRQVEITVKMIVAFSRAVLNGATPNDLIDCCAFTLSSNQHVIEECVDEYIVAVNAFRRLSRHVTGVEIAKLILASGVMLDMSQIAVLARAVHGLEGSKDILEELAGIVERTVMECRAVRGEEVISMTVKGEYKREEELDEFGMPVTEVEVGKISVNIDRLIDLVESLKVAKLHVPDSLTRVVCSTVDDLHRAIRVLHWACVDQDRLVGIILAEKKKLVPHGLVEAFGNSYLTSREDFLIGMKELIDEESDRLSEDQCGLIARAYAGFGDRFEGTVDACLKQLSVRLSQKRSPSSSSESAVFHPGERSEYSGSLLWRASAIDREEIASQICEAFEPNKLHPKLLNHFSSLVSRMSPEQLLRCARALPTVVVEEVRRRENDNKYLYGNDNPEEIDKILKVPEAVLKEILSRAEEANTN